MKHKLAGITLFGPTTNGTFVDRSSQKYEPISSVWERSDGELLEAMLSFYPTVKPEPILDATHNIGRFWKDSSRDVWSMDIDPRYKPKIVVDNRTMEGVPSAKFGTVVYDPPHVGPQGRDKSVKRFDVDFGATVRRMPNTSVVAEPGVSGAWQSAVCAHPPSNSSMVPEQEAAAILHAYR